jgi:hypothetical protein
MRFTLRRANSLALAGLLLALLLAAASAARPARAQAQAGQSLSQVRQDTPADNPADDPTDDPADGADDPADGSVAPEPDPTDPDDGWDPFLDGPDPAPLPVVTTDTVAGTVAMLRADGKAAIPRNAPKRVRRLIKQANRIIGKPYKLGGGHRMLRDRAYDCSGAVSFALVKAKLLDAVMVSGKFRRWGTAGGGRWISVYARTSHVYLEVAGLRLDTSSVGDPNGSDGVRWRPLVGKRSGFTARHPAGL